MIRADGVMIELCAIVTMPTNKLMAEIRNVNKRMPAILTTENREAWLPGTPNEAFKAIKQYSEPTCGDASQRAGQHPQELRRVVNRAREAWDGMD